MRLVLPALLLAGLLWPAAAAAQPWKPDVAAAAAWAGQRQGTVSFAVRTDAWVRGRGLDRRFTSASVIKAMLLATYLRRPEVRRRDLTAADRALLAPMVRRSDNITATRIRDIVGNAAIERFARAAGMTRFSVDPVWGRSLITARDQTRLFLRIDELIPRRHRADAMGLLRRIVPSQRWGMARVVPEGWTLYFKGGWGAGTGAVDHQVGLLRRGEERIAVAVLTVGSPSHAYGKATLEGVARRLLAGLAVELTGTAGSAEAGLAPP